MAQVPLTLPLPRSVNSLVTWSPSGTLVKRRDAVQWSRDALLVARAWRKAQGWTPTVGEKVIMRIWTYWPDARYRDTHNLYKVLLDALQGVLYDNDYWVLVRQQDFTVDPDHPRLALTLSRFAEEVTTHDSLDRHSHPDSLHRTDLGHRAGK